ncbi:MFS transporter [Marivita geojedonensis]|uniref:MFS transporter n=1 Tax=Marivita geojedonensis TaxID=1123756 RepID=UPI000A1F67BB|nr:MFS transporter [Marivita geojedonensis]PRY81890.1 MFS transporter [Marivita geojedonensis]
MRLLPYLRANASFLTAGAMLTFLSSFGQTYFISLFAGEVRTSFELSHGAWGGIYMVGTMASAALMIWAGGLTDLFRVRVLAPIVLGGLAAACLAMAFNPWVWALPFIVFALRFFGQGMCSHIAVIAMARWFVATRGRALSIASLGFAMGEALVPMAVVAAMSMMAWQNLWVMGAIVCIAAIPILSRLLAQERTPASHADSDISVGMSGRHWRRMEALRHPLFWCMVPAVLGPAAFNTAFFFHQVHVSEIKGLEHLVFVSFFPLYTAVGITSMVLSGWALDRLGTARLTPFYQLPMVAAFLTFAFTQSAGGLALGFVFLGMTSGANSTLPNAFWAEFYGTAHIGSIKSMATAVMVLGSAIGPGLTGLLIDLGVGIETQFIGVAMFFVATTLLMAFGITRAARDIPSAVTASDLRTRQP